MSQSLPCLWNESLDTHNTQQSSPPPGALHPAPRRAAARTSRLLRPSTLAAASGSFSPAAVVPLVSSPLARPRSRHGRLTGSSGAALTTRTATPHCRNTRARMRGAHARTDGGAEGDMSGAEDDLGQYADGALALAPPAGHPVSGHEELDSGCAPMAVDSEIGEPSARDVHEHTPATATGSVSPRWMPRRGVWPDMHGSALDMDLDGRRPGTPRPSSPALSLPSLAETTTRPDSPVSTASAGSVDSEDPFEPFMPLLTDHANGNGFDLGGQDPFFSSVNIPAIPIQNAPTNVAGPSGFGISSGAHSDTPTSTGAGIFSSQADPFNVFSDTQSIGSPIQHGVPTISQIPTSTAAATSSSSSFFSRFSSFLPVSSTTSGPIAVPPVQSGVGVQGNVVGNATNQFRAQSSILREPSGFGSTAAASAAQEHGHGYHHHEEQPHQPQQQPAVSALSRLFSLFSSRSGGSASTSTATANTPAASTLSTPATPRRGSFRLSVPTRRTPSPAGEIVSGATAAAALTPLGVTPPASPVTSGSGTGRAAGPAPGSRTVPIVVIGLRGGRRGAGGAGGAVENATGNGNGNGSGNATGEGVQAVGEGVDAGTQHDGNAGMETATSTDTASTPAGGAGAGANNAGRNPFMLYVVTGQVAVTPNSPLLRELNTARARGNNSRTRGGSPAARGSDARPVTPPATPPDESHMAERGSGSPDSPIDVDAEPETNATANAQTAGQNQPASTNGGPRAGLVALLAAALMNVVANGAARRAEGGDTPTATANADGDTAGGLPRGGSDYELLLMLAELVGSARPRNARREDVEKRCKAYVVDEDGMFEEVVDGKENEAEKEAQDAGSIDGVEVQDQERDMIMTDANTVTESEKLKHYISPSHLLASTGSSCTICLSAYAAGDVLRVLPCRHGFHRACCDEWLTGYNNACPVCREKAVESAPAAGSGAHGTSDAAQERDAGAGVGETAGAGLGMGMNMSALTRIDEDPSASAEESATTTAARSHSPTPSTSSGSSSTSSGSRRTAAIIPGPGGVTGLVARLLSGRAAADGWVGPVPAVVGTSAGQGEEGRSAGLMYFLLEV